MRIALVHNLPAGGQKRAMYEQIKRLSKKHVIDLYTLSCNDDSFFNIKEFINESTIQEFQPNHHFPIILYEIYKRLPEMYKQLADKINKKNYDVAYIQPCFLTQSPYILRYLDSPTIYSCAETKREFYEKIPRASNSITYRITYPFRYPIKFIDKFNTRGANYILVNSKNSKRNIDHAYGVNSKVNYLGLDIDKFVNNNIEKENTIITVGNFSFLKGHDFVIRSISKISLEKRPKLIVVGQGGVEKDYFLKLARSYQVDIQIHENISDEELVDLYNRAKCFVFAPIGEPFGLVVLEAAACGLPLVTVNEGGIPEMFEDGVLGKTYPRDEQIFANAVMDAMSHPLSDKEIQKRRAYLKEKWSWEKSVDQLEGYLREAAGLR